MPKIPQYNSQASLRAETLRTGKLTEEAPAVRVSPDSLIHETRALSQFGVTVRNIAEDIIKVKADQEYAKAKIEGYKTLLQIEAEASDDNDFQNFEPKYSKRIKETQENILKTIRSPQAKQAFQQDFELKSTYSFYDIMAQGRKRFLKYDEDLRIEETAAAKERYFSASTTQEKQNAKDELAQIFSRRVERRLLNRPEAAVLYKKEIQELTKGQLTYDLGRDMALSLENSYTYSQLKLGDKGDYAELSKEDAGRALEEIQLKVNRNKRDFEFQQNINQKQNLAQMIIAQSEGKLTYEEIKTGMLSGAIKAKDGEHLIKQSKELPAITTDYIAYTKIRELQAGGASIDESNQAILENSDKLTPADTKFLIEKSFNEQDKNHNMRLKFSVDALKGWAQNSLSLMPQVTSEIVYDFFNRIDKEKAKGARIDEILIETQKDYIKKYNPDTALLEDVPNIIASRNRIQKVFEKESKIKAKSAPKQVSIENVNISFDDL